MNERDESTKQAEIRVRVTIPDNCRGAPPGTYPLADGVELVITDSGYPAAAEARRQFLEGGQVVPAGTKPGEAE